MPYYSGSATVSAGPPVSYKMPVPSSSRYSSYRSSSSSLERPLYSSSTGSYLTSRSTYTTEYRSKFTSPSRTSSVPSYSRTSSLSDDSGRFTSSSRDRSESRETSSASTASSTTPSSTLGRRYNSASTISVGLSAAELYNKYSPSNYVSDIGRPPAASSTTSSFSRRSGSTTQPAETKASTTNSRLSGSRGAVGGCFTAAVTPSTERRSRASVNEVISHFSNASASNNNNNETSDSESSSSSGDEDGQGCSRNPGNNDDNGNNGEEEPQRSVAERRRRFDGSGSGGVDGSSNSTALHTTSSGRQHGGGSRRRREDTVPRASPSPVPIRKVFNNTGALSSDDEEEEEEETSKKSDDSGEEESSEDEEGSKVMSATRRTRAGVAGGASAATDPSNSSIAGASRYGRSQATAQLSPKTKSRQYHPESSILNASPRISRLNTRCCSNERAGLTGLRNIGNTCFMNSVIQCLSNTKPLLEYVLADSYLAEINSASSGMKGALFKAFATVIQELWRNESDATIVNTTSLKSQIQRFAPRFMGYSQQDAQEFLRYLLEGLHEDVNRVTSKPKPILTEIDDSLSDQQKAVESWKRYLRMDDSKVVDIFVGQLKSTLRCTVCGHCSVTFDPFWDLSLPIPSRTGQVRLQQCLDHFTREEVMDGDEKPTCSKCQMRRKCTKSFTIQKFPKILVLHLKRFSPMERFRGKLNVTVDFPLTGLDLSAYAASRGQGCMYNLYGVANHSGTTYSGHYTAYCRHPYSGDWHEYNDSRVSSISSRSVVSSEAYVLFYELSGHSSHL